MANMSCSEGESDSSDAGDSDSFLEDNPFTINPVLQEDIQKLKERFPQSAVSWRTLPIINEMDLDMSLPTTFLESTVTTAWGLIPGLPVVIRINLNHEHYLFKNAVIRVDVFQVPTLKRNGILMQIKNIAESFCRTNVQRIVNERQSPLTCDETIKLSKEEVTHLKDMGYTETAISQALNLSDGTVNSTIDILMQSSENMLASPNLQLSAHDGFLAELYAYMQKRLLTLNDYCPICDHHHDIKLSVMLKPMICGSTLCIFSFQTLGVMADASTDIVTEPQVVYLLLQLTRAAVESARHDLILAPYPTIVDDKLHEIVLYEQKKDITLLKEIISSIPHIKTLLDIDPENLKQFMENVHPFSYSLLRWIISSNRSHIVKLAKEQYLDFMHTNHQFLLRNSPPLEDQRFREEKSKSGSVFAFHGSPIENWHSIIRQGLLVASGTSKQLNGAAYGKGIYISPHLNTSLGYCNRLLSISMPPTKKAKKAAVDPNDPQDEFIDHLLEKMTCIALCEVINNNHLKRHCDTIWTCEKSEFICTRFFFVYDRNFPANLVEQEIHMKPGSKYVKQIEQALEATK
ncbi:protein mono-ADP-ribosyltransferase PARP6-like [Physella acuta]|uniref:protein mono-ADP-ribosyltransferase PARP6-like n=1 Tax=Physella acuta TaxID=109671 RepID=UPI0027DADEEB|nr:protein mono-ADP-ribosyltransferase PARP6-like [Physella acuta]